MASSASLFMSIYLTTTIECYPVLHLSGPGKYSVDVFYADWGDEHVR